MIVLTAPQRDLLLYLHDRRNAASIPDMAKDLGHQPRYLEQTVGAMLAAGLLVALPAITKADVRYQSSETGSLLATNISRALKDYGMSDVRTRRAEIASKAAPAKKRTTKKRGKRARTTPSGNGAGRKEAPEESGKSPTEVASS
jgi:hypothetical protein